MADCASEAMLSDLPQEKILLTMDLDGEPPPPLVRSLFGLHHRGHVFFARRKVDVMKHTVLTAAQRIVRAVRESTDLPAGCEKLHWRLTVIDDPDTVNACVLPNGHMFVYTGVLRDAPSQDCLAFLLGHECAHAALRHGGESLSQKPALEMVGLLLTTLVAALLPIGDGGFTLFQAACLKFGLSTLETPFDLLELDWSRDHESEADQVGLLLASRACYDPYHAQYLFHEFARERKEGRMGEQGPAVLSTHPLDEVREAAMRTQISKGMAERRSCACPPVDAKKREMFDRSLKAKPIRRLSCLEQDSGLKAARNLAQA